MFCITSGFAPPRSHEKWPSLLLGLGTLSLWWIIICCFGSKPTGTSFLAANSAHRKGNLHPQNLLPCNESQGQGLWSDREQSLWQTSEHKEIKGPSLLKCLVRIDSATQPVTWTTYLSSTGKRRKIWFFPEMIHKYLGFFFSFTRKWWIPALHSQKSL